MRFSKGSVIYNMVLFIFIFNLSLGIINVSGMFTSYLDPDAYPGLTPALCTTPAPDGFGGQWKNVGGVGYKCYLNGKEMDMSEDLIKNSTRLVENRDKLFEQNQDPNALQLITNLGGSFGNWISMALDAFRIFFTSVTFPTQFLLAIWPCPDASFAYDANVLDKAKAEPCTSNPSIDAWEEILGLMQYAVTLVYVLTAIQFVSNRTFRGID